MDNVTLLLWVVSTCAIALYVAGRVALLTDMLHHEHNRIIAHLEALEELQREAARETTREAPAVHLLPLASPAR